MSKNQQYNTKNNPYHFLRQPFYQYSQPENVTNPQLFIANKQLISQLNLKKTIQTTPQKLAEYFSGNISIPGFKPVTLAYAGHQFGHFSPQLGDGRAHLIGAIKDNQNITRDIQIKGSGRTVFSRGGDGKCTLGAAIREFIMSEALHALNVPTTRSLAIVTTGELVYRDQPLPGAIISRVASSHIRIGTFQYIAASGNTKEIQKLCDYTIKKHFSEYTEDYGNKYLFLLKKTIENQIKMITHWMRIGFIHGVMNTDNILISGHTIDYGPCAMMGIYKPETVYSSIDHNGRYAFANQPQITHWNLARLAECLIPLVDKDEKKAIEILKALIDEYTEKYNQAFNRMMCQKLGLNNSEKSSEKLISELLQLLENKQLDYTQSFDILTQSLIDKHIAEKARKIFGTWFKKWQKTADESDDKYKIMRENNPVVIPRNYHLENVINQCLETNSSQEAEKFLNILKSPYKQLKETHLYQKPHHQFDQNHRTFCGT